MGTVNDFGRALHLPNDIMSAIDVIIEGHSTKVDVYKVSTIHLTNINFGTVTFYNNIDCTHDVIRQM